MIRTVADFVLAGTDLQSGTCLEDIVEELLRAEQERQKHRRAHAWLGNIQERPAAQRRWILKQAQRRAEGEATEVLEHVDSPGEAAVPQRATQLAEAVHPQLVVEEEKAQWLSVWNKPHPADGLTTVQEHLNWLGTHAQAALALVASGCSESMSRGLAAGCPPCKGQGRWSRRLDCGPVDMHADGVVAGAFCNVEPHSQDWPGAKAVDTCRSHTLAQTFRGVRVVAVGSLGFGTQSRALDTPVGASGAGGGLARSGCDHDSRTAESSNSRQRRRNSCGVGP